MYIYIYIDVFLCESVKVRPPSALVLAITRADELGHFLEFHSSSVSDL